MLFLCQPISDHLIISPQRTGSGNGKPRPWRSEREYESEATTHFPITAIRVSIVHSDVEFSLPSLSGRRIEAMALALPVPMIDGLDFWKKSLRPCHSWEVFTSFL